MSSIPGVILFPLNAKLHKVFCLFVSAGDLMLYYMTAASKNKEKAETPIIKEVSDIRVFQ